MLFLIECPSFYRNLKRYHLVNHTMWNDFLGKKVLRLDKFYYVSLLETLKLLLANREIQEEIISPHQSPMKLEDFCDGSLYKTHPLFSSDR